jgi:Domain of unknown function (DUF4157)
MSREGRNPVARTPAPRASANPGEISRIPSDPGQQLSGEMRAFFERGFQHDLSHVRIHAGPEAGARAAAINAQAYTSGSHIVLGPGQSGAGLNSHGRALLAHELAHVVQSDRGRGAPPQKDYSDVADAAEREADASAVAVLAGRVVTLRETPCALVSRQQSPPQAWGSGWFPSQGGQIPGVTTAPPPPMWPPAPWQAEAVFEPPAARTPAGAPRAFDAYLALSPAERRRAFDISFANGNLAAALHALGPARAQGSAYGMAVQELLRRIEDRSAEAASGQTIAQMAATQAAFMRAHPTAAPGGGWGGVAPSQTRWASLTEPQRRDWTRRGNAAIATMVTHATTAAPQLALTAASFELDFEGVDAVSLGAFATGGSVPGRTVQVGFEFTVICEVNPAYALSTVEHELHGHPVFDIAGPSTAGTIYDQAAASVPGSPSGTETYHYYPSEIYSLLREIPLWVPTAPTDVGRSVALPRGSQTIDQLNPDPRDLIAGHLRAMRGKWDPSLHVPLLRGFWQRVSADPGIQASALAAFSTILGRVFGATAAARITAP